MGNSAGSVTFKRHMIEPLIAKMKPKPGDFFLTASLTKKNQQIRSLSGSKYGHGILYLGHKKAHSFKAASGLTVWYPAKTQKYCCFELPIKCAGLENILEKDQCFRLCHISPKKALTKDEFQKIDIYCKAFAYRKTTGGVLIGGMSDVMALVYAGADIIYNITAKDPPTAEFVVFGGGVKYSAKIINAIVQSGVEIADLWPNLNCTSLITWLCKNIDRKITTFSTTTSPDDLYNAVTKNRRFMVHEYTFDAFEKKAVLPKEKPAVKPREQPKAGQTARYGDVAIAPEF